MMLCVLFFALGAASGAEEASGHTTAGHEGREHHTFVVGAKGLVLATPTHEGVHTFLGPGVIAEARIPGAPLEVEVAAGYLPELDQAGFAVPLDLLLKGVHRVGRTDLAVGAGPMVTLVHERHEEVQAHPGVLGTVGAAYWVRRSVGLLMEVDAGATFSRKHGTLPELEGGLGVLLGF